jgi:hypothetical protein
VFQDEEKHVCMRPVDRSAEGEEHLLRSNPTIKPVHRSRKNHYEVMKKYNLCLYRRIVVKHVISTSNKS